MSIPTSSFKTNVNRAKTKRWVEAKSYSYDGDDWGDVDDYDEYDGYDNDPAPVQPVADSGQYDRRPVAVQPTGGHGVQNLDPYATSNTTPGRGSGGQYTTTGQPQSFARDRSISFAHDDERRNFYAGEPSFGPSGPSMMSRQHALPNTIQESHSLYGQIQEAQCRPRVDNETVYVDQHGTTGWKGPSHQDQYTQQTTENRTRSMVGNSSALDIHNRRDFSPSAMPPPLHTRGSPSPHGSSDVGSSNRFPPRQSSIRKPALPLAQQIAEAPPIPSDVRGPNIAKEDAVQRERSTSDVEKPLPFVRPADIYKRMQEEQERGRKSRDAARPTLDALTDKPMDRNIASEKPNFERSNLDRPSLEQHRNPSFEAGDDAFSGQTPDAQLEPLVKRDSNPGIDQISIDSPSFVDPQEPTHNKHLDQSLAEPKRDRYYLSSEIIDVPHLLLPPVQRFSGFGDSLFGLDPSKSADGEATSARSRGPPVNHSTEILSAHGAGNGNLQHQPSAGFRSVVHQAFDRTDDQVPPTPSSTIDRSSSERTSDISPVISRGPSVASPNSKVVQAEIREANTPAIAEEPQETTSIPASSGNLGTKQVTRKPSPSESPKPDSMGSKPASFIPGHRRDISTPSPDNSPARTPALEVNRQILEPQEAELAITTPTVPNFGPGSVPEPLHPQQREGYQATTDFTTRKTDLVLETKHEDLPPSPAVSVSAVDAQNPFLDSRKANYRKPSKTSSIDSASSRPDSPTKSRVRDLAEKFESTGSSRRGSQQSPARSSLSRASSQQLISIPSSKPLADRIESFRPRLPGAWESYASQAPLVASPESIVPFKDTSFDRKRGTYTLEKLDHNPTTADRHDTQGDDTEITPTVEDRKSPKPMQADHPVDPFAAVAAAGSALAGAFAAVVGLETHEEITTPKAEDSPRRPRSSQGSQDFSNTQGRSASIKNMAYHPEASRPNIPYLPDDMGSSVAATPSPSETPIVEKRDSEPLGYFPTIAPLQQPSKDAFKLSDNSTLLKRPSVLPSLSTDTTTTTPLYESDRLRRDIVRELSPVPPSDPVAYPLAEQSGTARDSSVSGRSSMKATGHESMVIPREYESYWNGSDSGADPSSRNSNIEAEGTAVMAAEPQEGMHQPLSVQNPMISAKDISVKHDRPVLPTRFSWEESQESFELPQQQMITRSPSISVRNSQQDYGQNGTIEENEKLRDARGGGGEPHSMVADNMPEDYSLPANTLPPSERPKAFATSSRISSTGSAMPGVRNENPKRRSSPSSKSVDVSANEDGPESIDTSFIGPQLGDSYQGSPSQLAHDVGHYDGPLKFTQEPETDRRLSTSDRDLPSLPPIPTPQPKIRPFREILALKTPSERIQAYNETRQQFASLDTGLAHWITNTADELPEHAHLLSNHARTNVNTTLQKSSTTRSKLAILRTSGVGMQTAQQPLASETTLSHGPSSSPGQGNSPSAGLGNRVKSQQVQAKGKDLLHTAGIFGGKANVAAKGLFSKGRSKLRGVGADKSLLGLPSSEAPFRGMQAPQAQLQMSEIQAPPPPPDSQAVLANQDDKAVNGQERENTPLALSKPTLDSALSSALIPYEPVQSGQPTDAAYSRDGDTIDPTGEGRLQAVQTSEEADKARPHPYSSRAHATMERRSSQHQDAPFQLLRSGSRPTAYGEAPIEVSETESYSGGYPTNVMRVGSSTKGIPRMGSPTNNTSGDSDGKDWAWPAQSLLLSAKERGAITSSPLVEKSLPDSPEAHMPSPRGSGGSEEAFHTADTSRVRAEQIQPVTQVPDISIASHGMNYQEPSGIWTASEPAPVDTEQRTIYNGGHEIPGIRPFSFIDASRYQPSQVVPDHEPWGPGVGGRVQGNAEQSPLPIQHHRSSTIDRENGRAPVYYGPEHDFGGQEETTLPARNGSFSRLFLDSPRRSEDPNIRHHPAFRQEAPNPVDTDRVAFSPSPIRRDEAGQLNQEVAENKLNIEPSTVDETQSKRRSWRGSRTSGMFGGTSGSPPRNDVSTTKVPIERPPPNITAGDTTKKQSRRASLFRSLTGRNGSDFDRDTDSRKPSLTEHLRDSKESFDQSRRGSQKQTLSKTVGQEGSKKKRFSGMGSLFGRSGHNKAQREISAARSAQPRLSLQQRHESISEDTMAQSAHPRLPPQPQKPAYYQNDVDQYTNSSPVPHHRETHHSPSKFSQQEGQSQPPPGGYYAPHRREASPSQRFVSPDHLSRQNDPCAPRPSANIPRSHPSYSEPKPSMWARRRTRSRSRSVDRRSRELYPENTSWTPEQGYLDHHISHSRSPSRHATRTPLPDTLPFPGNPNVRYEYPQPSSNPTFTTQSSQRDVSPAPPPPPPKDEWRRSTQYVSSRSVSGTPATTTQNTPSAKGHNRQSLPPLQTSHSPTSTKAKQRNSVHLQSPAERRARQMEIEKGSQRTSPWARKAGKGGDDVFGEGGGTVGGRRGRGRDDDEVVMSATSFPGQEWRPEGAWAGE